MIRILHGADFHLDSPLAALPPEKAVRRRGELRNAVGRMVELSVEEQVDIILLSGDLFDTTGPFGGTGAMLAEQLGKTPARVFIAPGNHDHYTPGSPYELEKWPENVHIFKSGAIEAAALPELGVTVYGAAFTAAVCPEPLLEGFRAEPGGISLMALHGSLGGAEERYNPITPAQIAASGLDYLALGHTHEYSGPMRAGDTVYAYPGCVEGRGFDECGDKGVIIAEIEKGGCRLRFVPLCARRCRRLELDVSAGASAALSAAVDSPEDIYRIYLTGRSAPPDIPALLAAYGPKAWHLELRDNTRPPADVWAGAGEPSLRGAYLEKLRAAIEGAPEASRPQAELAARFGVAALEGLERPGGEGL